MLIQIKNRYESQPTCWPHNFISNKLYTSTNETGMQKILNTFFIVMLLLADYIMNFMPNNLNTLMNETGIQKQTQTNCILYIQR